MENRNDARERLGPLSGQPPPLLDADPPTMRPADDRGFPVVDGRLRHVAQTAIRHRLLERSTGTLVKHDSGNAPDLALRQQMSQSPNAVEVQTRARGWIEAVPVVLVAEFCQHVVAGDEVQLLKAGHAGLHSLLPRRRV